MLKEIYSSWLDGQQGEYQMTTSPYESLSHSKWDCKYHIIFVPKNRRKVLYGKVRKYLGPVFHELATRGRYDPKSSVRAALIFLTRSIADSRVSKLILVSCASSRSLKR
jgi:hypothetical protein